MTELILTTNSDQVADTCFKNCDTPPTEQIGQYVGKIIGEYQEAPEMPDSVEIVAFCPGAKQRRFARPQCRLCFETSIYYTDGEVVVLGRFSEADGVVR